MIKTADFPALKARFRTLIQEDLGLARFRVNEDGDYLFRFERMNLKLVFHDDDPSYVWIGHFGFQWLKGPAVACADRCISEVNHRLKVVKLSRRPDADKDGDYSITASIGFMAEDVDSQNAATFERYLGLIKAGTNLFCELFEPEEEAAVPEPDAPTMRH